MIINSNRDFLLKGLISTTLITISSYGCGSILLKNPVLDLLKLNWITYGHGYKLATTLYFIGVFSICFWWGQLGNFILKHPYGVKDLYKIAITWSLPLLFALPIYTRDVYSYLAQGKLSNSGFNPFTQGVINLPTNYQDNISLIWSNTPTPYGPLFIWIAKLINFICGDSILAGTLLFRLIMFPGFIFLIFFSIKIANIFNIVVVKTIWLVGLNPIIFLHLIGGAHNELLIVPMMLGSIYFCLKKYFIPSLIIIGLAISIKIISILVLPFLFWIRLNQNSAKINLKTKICIFILTGSLPVLVLLIFSKLLGSGFGWITALSGSNYIINWLSPSTFISHVITLIVSIFKPIYLLNILAITRNIAKIVLPLILIWICFKYRKTLYSNMIGIQAAIISAITLYPALLPWYFAWIIPITNAFYISRSSIIINQTISIFILFMFNPNGSINLYNSTNILLAGLFTFFIIIITVSPLETHKLKMFIKK